MIDELLERKDVNDVSLARGYECKSSIPSVRSKKIAPLTRIGTWVWGKLNKIARVPMGRIDTIESVDFAICHDRKPSTGSLRYDQGIIQNCVKQN